jgi:hypothetical protein
MDCHLFLLLISPLEPTLTDNWEFSVSSLCQVLNAPSKTLVLSAWSNLVYDFIIQENPTIVIDT